MGREVQDQDEADSGDGRERDAGDAGGDRGLVDGERHEHAEEGQGADGPPRGAHVPATEIEVGEEKDEQGRGERRLGAGAPDSVGAVPEAEELVPETEVDAHVAEHRPGQCRGRGKNDRSLHHENDGEEEREQARDADDDALVERQARDLVLVGVRLPKIDLRQVRRAQLGDVGDRRAGVERQTKDIRIGRFLTVRRKALARGDRGNARRAQIGPDDAGADEAEVRRHDQALHLLVGVVRQREHDPGGLRAGLAGGDLDASHDAVGARCGRHLQTIALRAVVLDRLGQIDRLSVERDTNGFDSRRRGSRDDEACQKKQEKGEEPTHETPRNTSGEPLPDLCFWDTCP